MGTHLSLNMCPYWEGIVGEIRLFLLTSGTHIWSSHCGFGGGSRSLFPNTSNRRGGTESSFHGFHVAWASKGFFNKKSHRTWPVRKFPGLFSVYHGSISGMNTRSTGNHCARLWKDFYENGWHSRKTETTGQQHNLPGCVCSLHSESTQEAFTQSNVRLSRKNLQGL